MSESKVPDSVPYKLEVPPLVISDWAIRSVYFGIISCCPIFAPICWLCAALTIWDCGKSPQVRGIRWAMLGVLISVATAAAFVLNLKGD